MTQLRGEAWRFVQLVSLAGAVFSKEANLEPNQDLREAQNRILAVMEEEGLCRPSGESWCWVGTNSDQIIVVEFGQPQLEALYRVVNDLVGADDSTVGLGEFLSRASE